MKLHESPQPSARPTQAAIRKSVFQRLEPWTGRQVCDLYAGIGSLGIEALSRGAGHVTFVENDGRMRTVLQQNLALVKGEALSSIAATDVTAFLATTPRQFDVVLADPPYHSTLWTDLQPLVEKVLAPGGAFVMELADGSPVPRAVDTRTVGGTMVALWRRPA